MFGSAAGVFVTASNYWLTSLFILVCHENFASAQTTVEFSVYENVTIGYHVGSLSSNDQSRFLVTFNDNEETFKTYFNVERLESRGEIVTSSKLDHEQISFFEVLAYDLSNGKLYKIEIRVDDVNDNFPVFPRSPIYWNISEASQIGSKFDVGSATDSDSYPNNVKGYRIVDGNDGHYFRIDTRQVDAFVFADLIVNRTLNREEIAFFSIAIEAFDGGSPSKNGTIRVLINVSDVNDNAPTFDLSRYTVTVEENLPVGTDVIDMNATDLDDGDNGRVTYRIDRSKSDPDVYFIIDRLTGWVSLNKRLDYEESVQHKLVVEAVDGGSEPQVGSTVVIVTVDDVNDNQAVLDVIFLDQNESKISEAVEPGDYLARVSITDSDTASQPNISITLTGTEGRFALEAVNDVTYLIVVTGEIDRETHPSFLITLSVLDLEKPFQSVSMSYTVTVEDINDNPPAFEKDLYEVPLKDLSPGSFVIQLEAVDADAGINAEITYQLLTTNQSDWFMINPVSGLVTTQQQLDPTINPSPRLIVMATDKGQPPMSTTTTLIVTISDDVIGAPEFDQSSYQINIAEDVGIGTCVLQVEASSQGSTASVSYSIVDSLSSEEQPPFNVTIATGDVCVTSALDRETKSSFEFQVLATATNGRSNRATVHVTVDDVNEYAPIFHPIELMTNVKRNTSWGFPVARVTATDRDRFPTARITFSWSSGNGYFNLNSDTGQVTVGNSLATLEIGSSFNLTISAVDERGLASIVDARVIITIVDELISGSGPVFSSPHYFFSTYENAPSFTVIGKVDSTSPGGGTVGYQIQHDPPDTSWFTINSTSGEVLVSSSLDREIMSRLSFQVVSFSGNPPLYSFASVTITLKDVNDNAPHFYGSVDGHLPSLTVPYSIEPGSLLTILHALDDDVGENGTVTYSLFSNHFEINRTTGYLHLTTPLPQQEDSYELLVKARDLGHPAHVTSTSLTIEVRQPDANCPDFNDTSYQFTVAENLPASSIFASLSFSTVNPSSIVQLRITEDPSPVPFAIYPNGSLYSRQNLNYEEDRRYQFKVTASGNPTSAHLQRFCFATADVIVEVSDVNDNRPEFSQSSYDFSVSENLAAGTIVGNVEAIDRDSPAHAQVRYQFAVANTDFEIHPITGVITTLIELDRERSSRFSLLVEASDGDNLAQAIVRIDVIDMNDVAPMFLLDEHFSVVSVGIGEGTWVADMRAFDDDIDDNARIVYSMIGSPLFGIDSTSGRVETIAVLANKDIGIHTLIVTARDNGSPPLSSSITLKVSIQASSNPSQYNESLFVFTPFEDAKINGVLGSFESGSSGRRKRYATSFPFYRILTGSGMNAFAVNQSTGDLILKRKLNFELSSHFNITVEKRLVDKVIVLSGQINIRDTNDHTPTFASGTFYIAVDENSRVGTKLDIDNALYELEQDNGTYLLSISQVWRFVATDDDSGLDGEVVYTLVSQEPLVAFRINRNTGELEVNTPLDRETVSEYLLVVKAADRALTSPRFSTVSVVVALRDVNDNAPQFESRSSIDVLESDPIGYPLIRFTAHDPDVGPNGHVTYSLLSAGKVEDEFFHVDRSSGVLTLVKSLDHEHASTIHLNVSATDGAAGNPLTTYQDFVIHAENVNDESPRFERLIYDAEVMEGQSSGAVVTRVTASDRDAGVKGHVTYFLQSSTDSDKFEVDADSGVISTSSVFDREDRDFYTLTVFAMDNGAEPRYGWTIVNVTIGDINDNSPQFSTLGGASTLLRLEIPESLTSPQLIHVVTAHDSDVGENARITYSIEDGNTNGDFSINASTGQLWTTRALDHEQTSLYRLKLVATDHGQPARSAVSFVQVTVLDRNDNDPRFTMESYRANVSESLSRGQYVLTVAATDPDEGLNGKVRYYLAPSPTGSEALFHLDVNTGLITTAAVLDREQASHHQLTVVAIDSSPSSPRNTSVAVLVNVTDVNDQSPVFHHRVVRVNISRSAPTDSIVAHVTATDSDFGRNGIVTYAFSNATQSDAYFAINPSTGSVQVRRPLSDLTAAPFTIFLVASDQGNPPRSANAILILSIADEEEPAASLRFDSDPYDDVSMWENVQWGFFVTRVRADVIGESDSLGDVTYQILYGDESERAFSISQEGAITVSQPFLLDFETKPNMSLLIAASWIGGGNSPLTLNAFATVDVILQDENDNPPRFSLQHYYAKILEEQTTSNVIQLVATDLDSESNGDIRFHIAAGDPDNVFSINAATGLLETTRNLDREIHDQYELVIHATDRGESRLTATATVTVDVLDINDHRPTLVVPSTTLHVSENTPVGSLIMTATANDVDSDQILTFSVSANGSSGNHFNIDRYDGRIFLGSSLDYESEQTITLLVETSDGGKLDPATVNIIVGDVNDNYPMFRETFYHTKINESFPANTPILEINADDPDSGANGRVSYRILNILPNHPIFAIDNTTGVITLNASGDLLPAFLDYNIEVEAYDGGSPSKSQSVSVSVEVIAVNQLPPRFRSALYRAQVSESVSRHSSVINVTATDEDRYVGNRNIYYEISGGNMDGMFEIVTIRLGGGSIGEVRVARTLDRESRDSYQLTITASDRGNPELRSNATVMIEVADADDYPPRFNTTFYRAHMIENNMNNGGPVSVVSIYVIDRDTAPLRPTNFTIISGNDEGAFQLEQCHPPNSLCALITAKKIDYERKTQYRLTVQVTDRPYVGSVRPSITEVVVDVINVNEYRPSVESTVRVVLNEDVTVGRPLFSIQATDEDAGDFGWLTFAVNNVSTNHSGPRCPFPADVLAVENGTGIVSARKDLDYERCHMFSFTVDVCDPDWCASSSILLLIAPVDEYPPQFIGNDGSSGFRFSVSYDSPPGHVVGVVSASDPDAGDDGRVRFSIEDNSGPGYFSIEEDTGVIRLSRRIDGSGSHILLLTASSGVKRSTTAVAIAITDAPATLQSAQIFGIVFGLIALLVFIVIVLLAVRHRRSKRALKNTSISGRSRNDVIMKNGSGTKVSKKANAQEFYNVSKPVDNGVHKIAQNGKGRTNVAAGDYQLHDKLSSKRTGNGKLSAIPLETRATAFNHYGNGVALHQQHHHHRHSINRSPSPLAEETVEDAEVNMITSTSSSGGGTSSSSSRAFIQEHCGADSGVQQDMSDATDPDRKYSSLMQKRDQFRRSGRGNAVDAFELREHPVLTSNRGGVGDVGAGIRQFQTNSLSFLDSLGEGARSMEDRDPDKEHSKWTPDFQPISSVFNEIAKLRDESLQVGVSQQPEVRGKASLRSAPPPLLTSVPHNSDVITAPVPISQSYKPGPHVPLHGLYPKSNLQYLHERPPLTGSNPPHHRTAPPPYSQVMSSRPDSGASAGSSRSSHRSQYQIASLPFTLSTSGLPSSISRKSRQSSTTSPAMSPSLSPSLTPLTTHSPPALQLSNRATKPRLGKNTPDLIRILRSQSQEENKPEERMVHI